jgi:inosine-uridine nucleoside N-ribohydrolase
MHSIKHILACIDAPDPDNFVMLIALSLMYPNAKIYVLLTSRPVNFRADRSTKLWDFDLESSLMAQQASALRIKNFLKHFGIEVIHVYDGGIAPRTLVPHWVHFQDYYKFLDNDPLKALRHSELDNQEDLIKIILGIIEAGEQVHVAVGGPMTGLDQLITRNPDIVEAFAEVHAMFATWGNVELMNFGGAPRGASQFNVACHPQAAYNILMGLGCPIYLMPTEVTRVANIAFETAQDLRAFLPKNDGCNALATLYALWYDAAVRPRQFTDPNEKLFIHDLVSAFSLNKSTRELIYDVVPIVVDAVPHLAKDRSEWGTVMMRKVEEPGNIFSATGLKEGGAKIYLDTLQKLLDV